MNEKLLHYVRLSDVLAGMSTEGKKRTRKLVNLIFCPHLSAVGAVYYIPLNFLAEVVRGHDKFSQLDSTTEALATLREIHASNGDLPGLMVDLSS